MSVMIGRRQIAQHKIGTLRSAHIIGGNRLDQGLAVHFYDTFFCGYVLAAVFKQPLNIVFPALLVGRMIAGRENLASKVFLGFSVFFFHPLPDCGGSARVIAGVNYIIKGKVICFPLVLFGNGNRINLVYQHIKGNIGQRRTSHCRAYHRSADSNVQFLPHRGRNMVLLTVTHFMRQNNSNFIRIICKAV